MAGVSDYSGKLLNEIVIPGSHDAGVYTQNATNVQTQADDIYQQAVAGCRFFDLRVATHKQRNAVTGQKEYVHKAYHWGGGIGEKTIKSRFKHLTGGGLDSYNTISSLGGWGGGLTEILNHARTFVETRTNEFLILKFSKCKNLLDIARTCQQILGPVHYIDGGNLNKKKVSDLAGQVITIFDEKDRKYLSPLFQVPGGSWGITFFKALYDKKSKRQTGYDPNFHGLQYFGKFSSTSNVGKNTGKQKKTLKKCSVVHMDALGMMYWTTTGLTGNIRTRNDSMWTATNMAALKETWESGLSDSIAHRLGEESMADYIHRATNGGTVGGNLKSFMPNIVMIDYVTPARCNTVYELNTVVDTALRKLTLPVPGQPVAPPPLG